MSYIRLASERIRVQNYKVKPLRLILFQRGVLGSDRLYKGVKVFPIESPPPRDFNIDLEDSTFYMDPLDELVLSSLGFLLLKRYFSSGETVILKWSFS
jgi:peptide subunit release factor 1 (eRF1)